MVQITIFWTQNGFRLGFDGFSRISMDYIMQNLIIPDIGFLKILGENGQIYMKNGSRNLNSQYLRNTFLNRSH